MTYSKEIPVSSGWIRSAFPQFETCADSTFLLPLASVPSTRKSSQPDPLPMHLLLKKTFYRCRDGFNCSYLWTKCDQLVCAQRLSQIKKSLVRLAPDPRLTLSLAKSHLEHGSKTYRPCLSITQTESIYLLFATRLELAVAKKDFGITFTACLCSPTAAEDIAGLLDIKSVPIMDPSIIGRGPLSLVTSGLRDMARVLAQIDGRDPERVFNNTLREDIIAGKTAELIFLP